MISRRSSSIAKADDVFRTLLYDDSTCSQAFRRRSQMFRRCSQACCRHSRVLPGLSSALPGFSPALQVAPRCTWRPLHRSSQLWDLTTLGFWSDNSQPLPEAPSDQNTFSWCTIVVIMSVYICKSIKYHSDIYQTFYEVPAQLQVLNKLHIFKGFCPQCDRSHWLSCSSIFYDGSFLQWGVWYDYEYEGY